MAEFPVKWFSSDMRGAPVLSGTAGALISVLDACLLDGFGAVNATDVRVQDGIATAVFNSGESFLLHAVVEVSGATDPLLNGEARVLSTDNASITFATHAPNTESASGVITVKYAPAHWLQPFAANDVAVYKSAAIDNVQMFLRVDDSGARNARVVSYESMSDIDTGVGPAPTSGQVNGGGYWDKSNATDATARPYLFVVTPDFLLLNLRPASWAGPVYAFGRARPLDPVDEWCSILFCARSANNLSEGYGVTHNSNRGYVHRNIDGTGGAIEVASYPTVGVDKAGQDDFYGSIGGQSDGKIRFAERYIRGNGNAIRAIVPHVFSPPMSISTTPELVSLLQDEEVHILQTVICTDNTTNSARKFPKAIDITGAL